MTAYGHIPLATLPFRNLDDAAASRLRIRAAEHGRSAEAAHREILRSVILGVDPVQARQQALNRPAEFRRRTAGRGTPAVADLLAESRSERTRSLTGPDA
jgi:plasmid stability protein